MFQWLERKNNQRIFLLALLWALIGITAILLSEVLLPFILAALLAFVLHPLVTRLSRLHIKGVYMPRWVATLLIYMALASIALVFSTFFLPELYKEAARFLHLISQWTKSIDNETIDEIAEQISSWIRAQNLPIDLSSKGEALIVPDETHALISIDIAQILRQFVADTITYMRGRTSEIVIQVQHLVTGTLAFVFYAMLTFMLAGFMLADTTRIHNFIFTMIPGENRKKFDEILANMDRGLSGVVRGQLVICLVNAILTLIGLLILKVKFAFLLATIAGIFSLIPIFGSILSTIPIAFIATTQSLSTGLFAVLWIIAIHALEANLLNPKILGDSAKIHPVIVILALLAGEHFYGLVGALLAVPVASVLLTIFTAILQQAHSLERRPTGVAKP